MEKEGGGVVGNYWHVMFIRSWLSAVALLVLTMHAIFNIIPNAFSGFVTTRLKERRVDHYVPLSNNRISKHKRDEVLGKAEKDLAAVLDQYMSHLVKELQGTDFWKLRQTYSPGVQEYVEAATLCNFCKTGGLLNLDEINASLQRLSDPSLEPLQINVLDYLLGLADLTGELMRLAIGRISDGELEFAQKICNFVREIHREMMLIAPKMDDSSDIKTKMDTMLQSVMKIENACFSVHVRGSEYIPVLGSGETTCPSFGLPEVE